MSRYGDDTREGLSQEYGKRLKRMDGQELFEELTAVIRQAHDLGPPKSDRSCYLVAENAARLATEQQRTLECLLDAAVQNSRRSRGARQAVTQWQENIANHERQNELSILQQHVAQVEQEQALRSMLVREPIDRGSAEIIDAWRPREPVQVETLEALYLQVRTKGSSLRFTHLVGFFQTDEEWFEWLLVKRLHDQNPPTLGMRGFMTGYCPKSNDLQVHLACFFVYETLVERVVDREKLQEYLLELKDWMEKPGYRGEMQTCHAGLCARIQSSHQTMLDEVPTLPPVVVEEHWASHEIKEALGLMNRATDSPDYVRACGKVTMAVSIANVFRPSMYPELWRKISMAKTPLDDLLPTAALLAACAQNLDWCAELYAKVRQKGQDGERWQVHYSAYWALRVLLLHFNVNQFGGFANPLLAEEFVGKVYNWSPPQKKFMMFLS